MADLRRARAEPGSVLMLVPAGVLVLLLLAGITFDFAHVHVAQRTLADLAESVANDASTYAVDQAVLRAEGRIVFDQDRADRIAALAAAGAPTDIHVSELTATIDAATGTVVVRARGRVEPVFLRAVPGEAVPRTITATAAARLTG